MGRPRKDFCKLGHPMAERQAKGKTRRYCAQCNQAAVYRWRSRNPEQSAAIRAKGHRRLILKRDYGITEDDYMRMFDLQEGRCAICRSVPDIRRLSVDHDHDTGLVRGLLCGKCNTAIGLLNDDVIFVSSALEYLKHSSNRQVEL